MMRKEHDEGTRLASAMGRWPVIAAAVLAATLHGTARAGSSGTATLQLPTWQYDEPGIDIWWKKPGVGLRQSASSVAETELPLADYTSKLITRFGGGLTPTDRSAAVYGSSAVLWPSLAKATPLASGLTARAMK